MAIITNENGTFYIKDEFINDDTKTVEELNKLAIPIEIYEDIINADSEKKSLQDGIEMAEKTIEENTKRLSDIDAFIEQYQDLI